MGDSEQKSELVRYFAKDAVRVLDDDPEPRMKSSTLANFLQYGNHKDFASLIVRHEVNLCKISRLRTVRNRSESGGRAWTEYWLTKSQCIFLTAKCETEVANAILLQVIEIFDLYEKGILIPYGPQIKAALQEVLAAVDSRIQMMEDEMRRERTENRFMQETLKEEVRQLRDTVRRIESGVEFCVTEMKGSRKDLSKATIRLHAYLLENKFSSECPVCRDGNNKIVVAGELVGDKHHHLDRNSARFETTLVTCESCHQRYHRHERGFRAQFNNAFEYFHQIAVDLGFEIDQTLRVKAVPAEQLTLTAIQ